MISLKQQIASVNVLSRVRVTDFVGGLRDVNQHWSLVEILSFCIVPYIEAVEPVGSVVYQYISTDTCVPNKRTFASRLTGKLQNS